MSEPHHKLAVFPGDLTQTRGLSRLALLHLEWLKEHNYSIRTVYSRHYLLLWFVEWCAEREITSIDQVNRALLERYQRSLHYKQKSDGKMMTIGSQMNRINAVQVLFAWLVKQNYLAANPASDLEFPKNIKSLPKEVLTQSEVETILNSIDTTTAIGLRNRAII